MVRQGINNVKLGVFVLAGLLALVLSFYLIGKNQHLFGSDFVIKARFKNLNGLMEGNNVLYAGIQAGTVKKITLLNDTTIEVTLLIDQQIKGHIHRLAVASISTEGLMGNKIVNISPAKTPGPLVSAGDQLQVQQAVSTDQMLQTLSRTNDNIAGISDALKLSVLRINQSKLMALLDDPEIGSGLKTALRNVNNTAAQASRLSSNLNELVGGIKQGRGIAGTLLSDSVAARNLREAVAGLQTTAAQAAQFTRRLDDLAADLDQSMNIGKGTLHLLLKDSLAAQNIKRSLENVEHGTDGFNQNMEALKHNFLFRGYFKDKAKKQQQIKPDK